MYHLLRAGARRGASTVSGADNIKNLSRCATTGCEFPRFVCSHTDRKSQKAARRLRSRRIAVSTAIGPLMQLATVIGTLVASQKYPGLEGIKLLHRPAAGSRPAAAGEPVVAADATAQAGPGELVFIIASREAALAPAGDVRAGGPCDGRDRG